MKKGVDDVGRDGGEGFENEAALVHSRVRHDQVRLVDDRVFAKKQVEVNNARTPVLGANAAKARFDFQKTFEYPARRKIGLNLGGGVQVGRLRRPADGHGFDEGADANDANARRPSQRFNGGAQGRFAIAQVRAEPNIRSRHVLSGRIYRGEKGGGRTAASWSEYAFRAANQAFFARAADFSRRDFIRAAVRLAMIPFRAVLSARFWTTL